MNTIKKLFLCYIRGSVSQYGQDIWVIDKVLSRKKSGFFVELGASDGVEFSNTLLLEERFEWNGICIEPNVETFNDLQHNRRCICVNTCVGSREAQVEFFPDRELGYVVTSLNSKNEIRKSEAYNESIIVDTLPLAKILSENNAPDVIDYISLDVEGYEDEVLLKFPFSKYRFLCMTIERPSKLLRELLASEGYILVQEVPGLDAFYIHSDLGSAYRKNSILQYWNWYLFKLNALINKFLK